MMLLDARLEAYFLLTTIDTAVEIFVQELDPILVATFLWRVVTIYLLYSGKRKEGRWILPLATRLAMAACFASAAAYWANLSPIIWDSTLWTILLDLAMAIWFAYPGPAANADIPCNTCADMFCFFYTASGFFKLNTTFLSPDVSCATVFAAQHMAYYLDSIFSFETIAHILTTSKPLLPIIIVVVELAMGIGISIGRLRNSRQWTQVGLYCILYFHWAVCFTPRPNDISLFAVKCGARLVVLLDPTAVGRVLHYVQRGPVLRSMALATTLMIAIGIQQNFYPPNWGFLVYTVFLCFLQAGVLLESAAKATVATSPGGTLRPLWAKIAVAVAAFYSFGSLILGLQELATPNMYGNLTTHGGSNHLLVPTGLLFDIFRDDNSHPFGGGIVRIEETNSDWFQKIYPADLTHTLQPTRTLVPLLTASGSRPPIFFNASANRILGLFARGWVEHPGHLIPYTVPAIEFKRLFAEAMERDGTFRLVYAQLPGTKGDAVWRATAVERRVTVSVTDGVVAACEAVDYNDGGKKGQKKKRCNANDLPFQLRVPWLIRRLSMFHGYPVLYDADGTPRKEIMCYGT